MEILYNDFYKSHNTKLYQNLNTTNLESVIKNNKKWLETQSTPYRIDETYDQTPDRVAYNYYGDDLFYPVVLEMNNISSLLSFESQKLNNIVYLPSIKSLNQILVGVKE